MEQNDDDRKQNKSEMKTRWELEGESELKKRAMTKLKTLRENAVSPSSPLSLSLFIYIFLGFSDMARRPLLNATSDVDSLQKDAARSE